LIEMMKNYAITLLSALPLLAFSQHEFYIKGDGLATTTEVYVKNTNGTVPTLFVRGEIYNENGVFVNDNGEIELTGNWTNIADGTNAFFQSNGIERFSGAGNSIVSGDMDGISGTINQFYNLKIAKDIATNLVELNTKTHVNELGSVEFESNGVIRTDVASHNNNGFDYEHYLYLQNPDPASLTGHELAAGTSNNYIEGRFRWKTNGNNAYAFPVGGSNNGVEPFGIALASAADLILEGHIIPQALITGLLQSGVVYHDVGTPVAPGSTIASDGCSAGADGILDKINLTVHSGIGWRVFPISGTFDDYNIAFRPALVNDIVPFNPFGIDSDCENVELLYVSKDLIPGADALNLISGTQDWPTTPGYNVAPQTSATIAGVTGFHLSAITSFSDFGLHTTAPDGSGVALPVELVFLTAYGVENSFINVDWKTATEINNEGFQVERSTDGVNFSYIGFVAGSGNSSAPVNYSFSDNEVMPNVVYYYRLKQMDYDGNFEYSHIVTASLRSGNQLAVNIYPNPSQSAGQTILKITSSEATDAFIAVTDIAGRLVAGYNVKLKPGINEHYLNGADFSSGTYVISVAVQQSAINEKWVLAR
jgi:hypothetical protein